MNRRTCLSLVLVSSACGRGELPIPAGEEYGPCYGNQTCNQGLFCSGSNICVSPEDQHPGCLGADCDTSIPVNMVFIADFPEGAYWIDAYEASSDGNGLFGSLNQDVDRDGKIADPQAAAAHADSHGLELDEDGGEEGVELTTMAARSMPSVMPIDGATFYIAAAACANAGKRLCTQAEWLWACQNGTSGWEYPYGEAFDGADEAGVDCWVGLPSGAARVFHPTGSASSCVTPTGIFDLSGNVDELVGRITWSDRQACGGHIRSLGWGARCSCEASPSSETDILSISGFRCCRDP